MTSFPETSDSLLVQVRDPRNQVAWQQFVSIYRPVIFRTALARGMQTADAQDLTQQVLLAVASAVGRWEPRGEKTRFRHWLRRITRNAILNAVSRRPFDQATGSTSIHELLAQCETPDHKTESLIDLEYRRELFRTAARIVCHEVQPETWRIFELTVIEGVSNQLVAQQLGKSIGTIYTARCRTMQRLRSVIAELESTEL